MEGQPARDCWAVCFGHAFNADERMVAAGYDNGDIKILDLRNNCLLWETNIANGVVGLEFDRKDIVMNKLVRVPMIANASEPVTKRAVPTKVMLQLINAIVSPSGSSSWSPHLRTNSRSLTCAHNILKMASLT